MSWARVCCGIAQPGLGIPKKVALSGLCNPTRSFNLLAGVARGVAPCKGNLSHSSTAPVVPLLGLPAVERFSTSRLTPARGPCNLSQSCLLSLSLPFSSGSSSTSGILPASPRAQHPHRFPSFSTLSPQSLSLALVLALA